MAKKSGREWVFMECPDCSRRNYRTSRSARGDAKKLQLKKYCPWCRKQALHKEKKK